jgi:hypothetical protein
MEEIYDYELKITFLIALNGKTMNDVVYGYAPST